MNKLKVKLKMEKNMMEDAEAKWVANTPGGKKIFVLKYFVVIKVKKLQIGRPSENIQACDN